MYSVTTAAMVITIFGNLVIMISISHFKQLHSPTNFLILSMATTDFLLGFVIMPYSTVRSVQSCWYFGDGFCKFHTSFDMMLSLTSIFHLCSIAIDRFYAVCYPLHYRTTMTISMIKRLLAFRRTAPAFFSFCLVLSEANVSGMQSYEILVACFKFCALTHNKFGGTILFTTCFFTPGSIMVGIYRKIFIVSKRHARVISNKPENKGGREKNLSKKKDSKAAKTLGIVVGVFLACWLPCFLAVLIDPYLDYSTPIIVLDLLVWLGYFNSTYNPLIHGFFYPWFWKALKHIVSGKIFSSHSETADLFAEAH
ncbi:LOW QUALITY PROTEIN: trace amine-associated receptor 3-like [Trichechus manatus latirostris]|uniref:LOW QUALITY PROTEIN: trace amine-associated receptor 3-like n=1 Tax=Trichechus manatus latirostris TaxID=127582 RepID=A0A2Y9FYA3_TRIMA|nr:LOW QUALITY PROTEIN: trace amine-associated receptor 3-like [Trichechus manatus latirostris]